jgi:glycosyltransferase involved in cell wall biosynthesis
MEEKRLLLLYPFEMFEVGIQKDLGRIPKAFYQYLDIQTQLLCFCFCGEIPKTKGVEIQAFSQKSKFFSLEGLRYLRAARVMSQSYDYVMFFGTSFRNYFLMRQFRKNNPKGKIYWKLDIDSSYLNLWDGGKWAVKMMVKRPMNNHMLKWADLVSTETSVCYRQLQAMVKQDQKHKIMLFPNGFDVDQTKDMDLNSEKKAILLFVGRLDDPIKNAIELLKGLSEMNFDGEFQFIGPAQDQGGFLSTYRRLCKEVDGFARRVRWLGEINGREQLYSHYAEAMGLVLASDRESFGIVLGEAAYFDNYIISTNVGAAGDITQNGKYGSLIEVNDFNGVMQEIQASFRQPKETMDAGRRQGAYYRENFLYQKLVTEKLSIQEFFYGE